jgi:hypothetical protein
MNKTAKILTLALAVGVLPAAGAQAKSANGNGHGKGHAKAERDAAPGTAAAPDAKPVKSKSRCERSQSVGFVLRGGYVSFAPSADAADAATAGDLTLDVPRANKHARGGETRRTVSIAGARVAFEGVADTGGDGVGFEDARAGDRVKVVGKLVRPKRGCEGTTSVVVKKVKVSREAPETAEPAAEVSV